MHFIDIVTIVLAGFV